MSTAAAVRTIARYYLREVSTQKTWSDDLLLSYLNEQIARLAGTASQFKRGGWFRWREEKTVTAGVAFLDLGTLAYQFRALKYVSMRLSNLKWTPLEPIDENKEDLFDEPNAVARDFIPGYRLLRPAPSPADGPIRTHLYLDPLCTADRLLRVKYAYRPAVLLESETVPLPAEWDHLLGMMVADRALSDTGQRETQYSTTIQTRLTEFVNNESLGWGEDVSSGVSEVVGW